MQLKDVLELGTREGVRRYVEKRAGIMLPLAVGAMVPGIVHKAIDRAHSTERQLDRSEYAPMDHVPGKMAAMPPWLALPMAQMMSSDGPIGRAGSAVGGAGKAVGGQLAGSSGGGGKPGSGFMGGLGQIGASPAAGVAGGISGGISEMIKRKFLGREMGEKKDPFSMAGAGAASSFGKEMGTSGANLLRDIANKAMEAAGHAGDSSAREAIIGDLKRTDSVLANADDATLMEAYHTMTRFAPVLSTDKNAVRSFLRQAVMSGSGPDFMSIKLLADSERAVTGDKER